MSVPVRGGQGPVTSLAERLWAGGADLAHSDHPVHAQGMVSEEIADGVLVYLSLASVTAVGTEGGLVLLDAGGPFDVEALHDHVRSWRPDSRLAAAVFSHHHIDHVFGTARFEEEARERHWPAPIVYGHRGLEANFDRYLKTRGLNRAINARQFAIDPGAFSWPDQWRRPDVMYDGALRFSEGGLTFDLHHARGETDDATWTWVPELRLLHPGDLFIWAVPNAGNPQKVQRYAGDWAAALREMAGLGAEVMVPGHGVPIIGAGRISQALGDTAELLESLEAQTLALMNRGLRLDEVLHNVAVPDHLTTQPYLQPVYDHPQFVVRNIWRYYGGWYDGDPDQLLPAPRSEQAREWVGLAGGIAAVCERARSLSRAGNLRMAAHLAETAMLAAPDDADAHALRAEVYEARAEEERSTMASNLFSHAAAASRRGRRDLAEES